MYIARCCWNLEEKKGSWPHVDEAGNVAKPPVRVNRRLTAFGQQIMRMLYQIADTKDPIPWVVASRHADTNRKVRLLSYLAKQELLSPTDFSMSVHNAIIGLFSIATQNKCMHTAVSGSACTFESGLLEAYALQKTERSTIGYLYYDTFLSGSLIDIQERDYPMACVVMLLDEKEKSEQIVLRYGVSTGQDMLDDDAYKLGGLLDYLGSNEKKYTMSVPGGMFFLERTGSKS